MSNSEHTKQWLAMLEQLPLTKSEQGTVDRFAKDPEGRSFLSVAEILRSHKKAEESLELLTHGVARHPTFTVARVVLARELYLRGMTFAAWQTIEDSPAPLAENVLAQKLRYKLALLLGYGRVVREVFEHLHRFKMVDDEIRRLSDLVALSGLERGRDFLIQELRAKGIDPHLPERGEHLTDSAVADDVRTSSLPAPISHVSSRDSMVIEGFHVMPLADVFRIDEDAPERLVHASGEALELDSTTLAEIYAKQGHYAKALGVYRRLLKLNPNNDYLRKKVLELGRLEREQKEADLAVDPGLADQIEQLEIIEAQIKFYNKLLHRLQGN